MAERRFQARWIYSINDKYTFCGAYCECYEEISRHWNAHTKAAYDEEYERTIFPSLPEHNDRAIDTYTKDDYDAAMEAIIRRGSVSGGSAYADTTIRHFRYLIKIVVEAAAKKGLCENVLWGSVFSLSGEDTAAGAYQRQVMLPKSLSPRQEKLVADALMKDMAQSGERIGLLMMFALGLRNGEACGTKFGDIRPMLTHPEHHLLWIYKSTISGTNALQSSAKTKNADRILPVPPVLLELLRERKRYIESNVAFPVSREIQTIDDMPIVCMGQDYGMHCSASRLTAAGKELFARIGMQERQLSVIDEALARERKDRPAGEKDPTAYLFRRNFGTHLHILGLTESEIQYVIGHDIEDSYETRNEFISEEKLLAILYKMSNRPIFNDIPAMAEKIVELNQPGRRYSIQAEVPTTYTIKAPSGRMQLRLSACEPGDPLHLEVQSGNGRVRQISSGQEPDYGREIDILSAYHSKYR